MKEERGVLWDIPQALNFILRDLGNGLWGPWTSPGSVCKPSQARSWVQDVCWEVSPKNDSHKKQQEGLHRALLKEQALHVLCINP